MSITPSPSKTEKAGQLTVVEWLTERADNCARIGRSKFGAERRGWAEDERYFRIAVSQLSVLHKASRIALGNLTGGMDGDWPEGVDAVETLRAAIKKATQTP